MTKEQIIDDYIKSIRHYLNVGLCEGQANGSFGEDLMRHFDIIAECFKETTLIEHDLGIDLITLFNVLKNGVYYITKTQGLRKEYVALTQEYMGSKKLCLRLRIKGNPQLYFKDYGKTWALTMEELK